MTVNQTAQPTRCAQCQEPMESPVACAHCGALGRIPTGALNCFELFGLPRLYDLDLDVLHHKYLSLSRVVHPDASAVARPERRQQALILSADLNQAYETLRDPAARAEYLLSLAGGPSASGDKSVPGNLLSEVMMLRDAIDESAGDAQALASIRQRIEQRRAEALETVARLARQLDQHDEEKRRELRQQLNTMKYWNNLLSQIPRMVGGDKTVAG